MLNPRLEDRATGLELQLVELVERRERARVQGRVEHAHSFDHEIEEIQDQLARTAELLAE